MIYCSASGSETYKASFYERLQINGGCNRDVTRVPDIEVHLYSHDTAESVKEVSVEAPCVHVE